MPPNFWHVFGSFVEIGNHHVNKNKRPHIIDLPMEEPQAKATELANQLESMHIDTKGYPHLSQWAISATSRTSYNNGWEASCLTGPPRVYPQYGDRRGAWAAQNSRGTHEWLELKYEKLIYLTGMDIYETYNPGHVWEILCRNNETKEWVTVYTDPELFASGKSFVPEQSRIWRPKLTQEKYFFRTNEIRLNMNCTNARSWSEIDCVHLHGLEVIDWTTQNNRFYPNDFKAMVKTMLLINQRHYKENRAMWLPQVLLFEIFNIVSHNL